MKKTLFIGATVLLAGSLLAAESSPKDDVIAATKKLGEQANYSWKTTVVVPESAQFKPGPSEGQTEKDGFTHLTLNFGDNTTQVFMKDDKRVVSDPVDIHVPTVIDSALGARFTDLDGNTMLDFRQKLAGPPSKHPVPATLTPIANVRELAILDAGSQTILDAILSAPDKFEYLLKRDFSTSVEALLQINADSHKARKTVRG